MRTLAGGSIFLAFVVVLVSWDASKRFIGASSPARAASFEAAHTRSFSPAVPVQAPGARAPEVLRSGSATLDPTTAEPARSAARSTPAAQQPTSTARRPAGGATLPVRQFTPGSRAHAEALVTAIDSEESRNTVAPLARLYFAFFERTSDYEGLNYWIEERDAGVSLESIADEFAGSTEFRLRYGTLDDAAFIDRMFRNVFDVPPDNAQRAYWIAQLESGTTRGQVMLAFSESGAFRAATSNEVFVTLAYAQALRREPDAAGFARWVRFLDAGNPREAVIAGLLARR